MRHFKKPVKIKIHICVFICFIFKAIFNFILQSRTKWQRQKPNLQPEDIFILKYDKGISCHWPLARVIEGQPGKDGLVRVATVKTASGTYKRPVVKLALLHRPDDSKEPSLPLPPGGCSVKKTPSQEQQQQPAEQQPPNT